MLRTRRLKPRAKNRAECLVQKWLEPHTLRPFRQSLGNRLKALFRRYIVELSDEPAILTGRRDAPIQGIVEAGIVFIQMLMTDQSAS